MKKARCHRNIHLHDSRYGELCHFLSLWTVSWRWETKVWHISNHTWLTLQWKTQNNNRIPSIKWNKEIYVEKDQEEQQERGLKQSVTKDSKYWGCDETKAAALSHQRDQGWTCKSFVKIKHIEPRKGLFGETAKKPSLKVSNTCQTNTCQEEQMYYWFYLLLTGFSRLFYKIFIQYSTS